MSDTVIKVEGLGKRYRLRHQTAGPVYHKLSDTLIHAIKAPLRWLQRPNFQLPSPISQKEDFWALKDINFEIKRGEVLGIIGRNGAGKSTLLKILSRITEPTVGRVTLRGRVASLLEVGTGFHPELTGRENVFLNGAMLGMTRIEITSKFDEITAFAGVDKFLDTPVKHYSSGMHMRLAFAVAAHLDPEILIVDEVLAVGDAEFQKMCLGKMQDVSRSGRTVIFVSHNMNAIERQCQKVIWLDRGMIAGATSDVRAGIHDYLHGSDGRVASHWINTGREYHNDYFMPESLQVGDDASSGTLPNYHDIQVRVAGEVRTDDPALNIGIAVYAEDGTLLFWTLVRDTPEDQWPPFKLGRAVFSVKLPSRWLNEGTYRVELIASLHFRLWILQPSVKAPSVSFTIQGGLSDSPLWDVRRPGMMAPVLTWECLSS